ncbi:MAG: hypothetical protein AAFU67_09605 [Bacteroidota bacterium]
MHYRLLALKACLSFLYIGLLPAQDTTLIPLNLRTQGGYSFFDGYLHRVEDDAIWVAETPQQLYLGEDLLGYKVNNIKSVRFTVDYKKKSNAGIGFLIGASAGLLVGLLIRPEPCDSSSGFGNLLSGTCQANRSGTVVLSTSAGGLLGILFGSTKTNRPVYETFNIRGRLLNEQRAQIERFAYRPSN